MSHSVMLSTIWFQHIAILGNQGPCNCVILKPWSAVCAASCEIYPHYVLYPDTRSGLHPGSTFFFISSIGCEISHVPVGLSWVRSSSCSHPSSYNFLLDSHYFQLFKTIHKIPCYLRTRILLYLLFTKTHMHFLSF